MIWNPNKETMPREQMRELQGKRLHKIRKQHKRRRLHMPYYISSSNGIDVLAVAIIISQNYGKCKRNY